MIRLSLLLLTIIAYLVCVAWLSEEPGVITVHWGGYLFSTDTVSVFKLASFLCVAAVICVVLLRSILNLPGKIQRYFAKRHWERGYRALSDGLIAAYSHDKDMVTRHSRKARKFLGQTPLVLLLELQEARSSGNAKALESTLRTMCDLPECKNLGLYGLHAQARHENDLVSAANFARKALGQNPQTPWAISALFDIHCLEGRWKDALSILPQRRKIADHSAPSAERERAILLTAEALRIEESETRGMTKKALELALEAHGFAPDLVPAAVLAARLLLQTQGNDRKIRSIIEKCWKLSAHPDLARIYARTLKGIDREERLRNMESFVAAASSPWEGQLALARFCIESREWSMARTSLARCLELYPSQEVCLLMARLEQDSLSNDELASRWLARAVHAPLDPTWVDDGHGSPVWKPVSPVTGHLDAFSWSVPPFRPSPPPEMRSLDTSFDSRSPTPSQQESGVQMADTTEAVKTLAKSAGTSGIREYSVGTAIVQDPEDMSRESSFSDMRFSPYAPDDPGTEDTEGFDDWDGSERSKKLS